MRQNEWWKDFFSGVVVDMWGMAMDPEQTRKEADFIQKALQVPAPARLLDVPCGNGRHSIELASRGYGLTGVDISKPFLEQARKESSKRGLAITWEQLEMRDLLWSSSFDGAFSFGNSFGFLDDEGNAEFLRAVNRVLRPDARIVLDASSVAENILRGIEDHTEMKIGDILFVEDNRYDHVTGRLDTEYTFVRGDQTEKRAGSHRIYTFRELQGMLSAAGFVDCQAFGSIDEQPFRLGSHGLYFVAAKRA